MSIYGLDVLATMDLPTITMMRLVRLPFIEQLDQFGVGLLMFRFLPIVSLYLWAGSMLSHSLAFCNRTLRFHIILQAALVLAVGFGFMQFRVSQEIDVIVMSFSAGWFILYAPVLLMLAWFKYANGKLRRKEG